MLIFQDPNQVSLKVGWLILIPPPIAEGPARAHNQKHNRSEKSSVVSNPNVWHRRSLPSTLNPPSREELNTYKKIVINLKRTLFVLKCLLRNMPICPITTMKAYDYENQSFRFKDNSLALKLAINVLLNPRSPAPTKQMGRFCLLLHVATLWCLAG